MLSTIISKMSYTTYFSKKCLIQKVDLPYIFFLQILTALSHTSPTPTTAECSFSVQVWKIHSRSLEENASFTIKSHISFIRSSFFPGVDFHFFFLRCSSCTVMRLCLWVGVCDLARGPAQFAQMKSVFSVNRFSASQRAALRCGVRDLHIKTRNGKEIEDAQGISVWTKKKAE